ncbi:hypothetical protein KM043_013638 [Ampulex compressa]|nr:hypothetical protein KM043_013638 [Ampulex compressa]
MTTKPPLWQTRQRFAPPTGADTRVLGGKRVRDERDRAARGKKWGMPSGSERAHARARERERERERDGAREREEKRRKGSRKEEKSDARHGGWMRAERKESRSGRRGEIQNHPHSKTPPVFPSVSPSLSCNPRCLAVVCCTESAGPVSLNLRDRETSVLGASTPYIDEFVAPLTVALHLALLGPDSRRIISVKSKRALR